MSKSSTASSKPLSTKSAWAKGLPQYSSASSLPSQSPALPNVPSYVQPTPLKPPLTSNHPHLSLIGGGGGAGKTRRPSDVAHVDGHGKKKHRSSIINASDPPAPPASLMTSTLMLATPRRRAMSPSPKISSRAKKPAKNVNDMLKIAPHPES
ncbi:hypothetical protein ONZ45_g10705 [Pleurotus djamor]|nr:hypothetical protein ONZ45_g10705 [Pleurotus djamor]